MVENDCTIQDPLHQGNIFNQKFSSKAKVKNPDDPVPNLERKDGISNLDVLNTSPLEVAKIVSNIKKIYFSQCGIPVKCIHIIATPVSFSLSRLLNNLFEAGLFLNLGRIGGIV